MSINCQQPKLSFAGLKSNLFCGASLLLNYLETVPCLLITQYSVLFPKKAVTQYCSTRKKSNPVLFYKEARDYDTIKISQNITESNNKIK